ncbi:hypothetical protein D9613_003734 [Agrocybe pediades]|uniref:Survival protein SurE-like phosphatase/nucleotidase domain-containing protein n=1 Tax=Agrocybe pediades TaxID=84607 RepID=A0A8H4VJM2_9AGAR|nr:hypothetical protein D9613_003734 [Agrocybe pediades]
MRSFSTLLAFSLLATSGVLGQKVVLTNDDGWTAAQIPAEYAALKVAGFDVILSAPAVDKSGTGSSTATPTVLTSACECSTVALLVRLLSGATRLTVGLTTPMLSLDAVRFGIQTLAPKFFGTKPDFVISGFNIGNNLGSGITGSGAVGVASEPAKEGIPSIVFSGASGSLSYTTLSQTTASSTVSANFYTSLIIKFVNALLNNTGAILPTGISLNVNSASTLSCTSASSYKFVLTRLTSSNSATDVTTCGTNHLPAESTVIKTGCIATVSVFNATTKADVGAATQQVV